MTRAEWILTGGPHCHWQVAKAIRKGQLPHPIREKLCCADCGGVAVEYDHRDYNKPLDVQPVCRRCNLRRGSAIRRQWSGPDELRANFAKFCTQRVVPWAREWCIARIHETVTDVERATEGAVTRYDLRPDIFGPRPSKAAAA